MIDLTSALLPRLEANQLAGMEGVRDVFYPAYQDQSIVNLPASLLHWLGAAPLASAAPPLADELLGRWPGGFRHVVLMVMDGFGLDMVQRALSQAATNPHLCAWANLPEDALLAPLTSVVPSTTATAMTSLWTGAYPAEHGVVGYTQYLKEYSMTANMILHSPAAYHGDAGSLRHAGFRPETFLPVMTMGTHLAGQGIPTYAYTHQSIARSGLSTMLFQGAQAVPVLTLGDMLIRLSAQLDAPGEEQSCSILYWSELDDAAHRYGPGSRQFERSLAAVSLQLGLFLDEQCQKARGDTLFILTADHGHIHTPLQPELELRRHPDLLDCLTMIPTGESRLPYAYLKPGCEARFREQVERLWPGRFQLVPAAQFIAAGMFGPRSRHPNLADRVGDWVVVAPMGDYWWFDLFRDNPLLGRHGGLSRTEMLVPFLAIPL
jgi:hypothetical protein